MLFKPPALKIGDTIGIAATARKMTAEELQPAITLFESWGLRVKLADNIFSEHHQFAGTDDERATGFQKLLDDADVKAIINARGGYGTVRVIDKLDFTLFKQSPKWIIGYSDITVLHSHIHTHCRVQTLHATMPVNMQPDKADAISIQTLKTALMGDNMTIVETPYHPFNRMGEAAGVLVGGNLSVIYSLLGSASDIDTKGKILFLEDLDEYLYHIDRMVMNLKRNGKLTHLAGLIVGGMSDMKDNTIPFGKTAEEIIADAVSEFNYPVCFGFHAGHKKENIALRMGAFARLGVKKEIVKLELE